MALSILATLQADLGDLDRITRIVKVFDIAVEIELIARFRSD